MRDYIKPFIEDEDIELEDIIAVSPQTTTENGETVDPWETWE